MANLPSFVNPVQFFQIHVPQQLNWQTIEGAGDCSFHAILFSYWPTNVHVSTCCNEKDSGTYDGY